MQQFISCTTFHITYILCYFLVHPCDKPDNFNCSQNCVKEGEEAVCTCNERFEMTADGKICKESKLFTYYWTNENTVQPNQCLCSSKGHFLATFLTADFLTDQTFNRLFLPITHSRHIIFHCDAAIFYSEPLLTFIFSFSIIRAPLRPERERRM